MVFKVGRVGSPAPRVKSPRVIGNTTSPTPFVNDRTRSRIDCTYDWVSGYGGTPPYRTTGVGR